MNPPIVHFANTFVGKPGNIGVRTAHILRYLVANNQAAACVCRGSIDRIAPTHFIEMGWLGHIPRMLNGFRIYVWPKFNHRPLDIALFEHFAIHHLDRLLQKGEYGTTHVWDTCPRLIRRLKSEGLRVILDIPIAPATYGKRMRDSCKAPFLLDDPKLIEIELAAFDEADRLIAPSPFVADELVLAGVAAEKIAVIEFGTDSKGSVTTRKNDKEAKRKAGLDFCFLGLVNRRKGIAELLEAWSSPAFADDRLHLCGRVYPEIRASLVKGKGGRTILPGFIQPHVYLAQCDVFVFPSWLEGSAKAVFEAMACGLPVIVTASAGSVVRDGVDGFIIAPGDARALRDKMLAFKEHPEWIASMGAHARERAAEFTWERYARRVAAVYSAESQ